MINKCSGTDSLQQLDVCHSAETEMRDEKRSARIHEKKLFLQIRTRGQVEESVASRVSLKDNARDQVWDTQVMRIYQRH